MNKVLNDAADTSGGCGCLLLIIGFVMILMKGC